MSAEKPPYPERTIGFARMELRPILKMGRLVPNMDGGYKLVDGWIFDHSKEQQHKPAWSAELIHEMIVNTIQSIRALPGPSKW